MTDAHSPDKPTKKPTHAQRLRALNDEIRYAMWSVFVSCSALGSQRGGHIAEVEELFKRLGEQGVEIRGTYDLAGMRADADLMVWWHAPSIDQLQNAYSQLRNSALGRNLKPTWSVSALHRPAEFNKAHVPAFIAGEEPRDYVCVYPFVRSYEWYLLPDEERRFMLAEHGKMARDYPDVRANTVPSFALTDYEWILAFEGDDLYRVVDLMRHLRGSTARRHVREEVPFFTGRRKPIAEIINHLP